MARLKRKKAVSMAPGDSRLIERVRSLLANIPNVTERRMFGGTGFMIRGNLCVTARPTRIMCRIDPTTHQAAIKRKGCRTVIMGGREYSGYVYVDAAAVMTRASLESWVTRSLEYNRTLPKAAK